DQCESDTESGIVAAIIAVALGEQIENLRYERRLHPDAVVAHTDLDSIGDEPGFDLDATAGGRVLDCIAEDVADDLDQSGRVAVNVQRFTRHLDPQLMLVTRYHGLHGLNRARDDRGQGHGLSHQIDLAAGDTGNVQ